MAISHYPATANHLAASAYPSHAAHTSILRRRSRAEKDDSSDDGDDSEDELDDNEASESDDDDRLPRARAHSVQSKRVKLSSLLPLAFTATSLSPPFHPSSRAGNAVAGSSSSLLPPMRPGRSRSMGDGSAFAHGNGHSSGSPPALTLQSPPRSPLHHSAAAANHATANGAAASLSPSSPSTTPSATSSAGGKRVPLHIIPPSTFGRTRSSGALFSPRSHTTQFLAPPAVTHSPRAVQPDSQHSPLETLFTRLTMEDARRGWGEGMEERAAGQGTKGLRARRGSGGEHRRSFSMTLSPAMAQSIARSGSVDTSPLKLIAEEDDETADMHTPPPSRLSVSPLATPWLVRVDSAEDMQDHLTADSSASATPPTALTGDSILHFFHQLRLDANDWTTLALAWRWQCKHNGVIYRSEFIDGMRAMGCETIEQLQSEVNRLKEQLLDGSQRSQYKDFFAFVFHFVRRTHETNRRTIPMDVACRLLESLLRSRYEVHVERLCRYMREVGCASGGRASTARVTFDQWQSLLDWCQLMDVEYQGYEEDNSCWPVMLDDFIEWMRQHDKPAMARYDSKRQERITQRQLTNCPTPASSHSSYPNFPHPHQSDSIVDRITRLRVEHTVEPLAPSTSAFVTSSPTSLTPRRSTLSVRVPRPSSIEAVSLDSDDMPRPQPNHTLAGGGGSGERGLGGELDASMLSRSLPSIGSIIDLHEDVDKLHQAGRTFGWDRSEAMSD